MPVIAALLLLQAAAATPPTRPAPPPAEPATAIATAEAPLLHDTRGRPVMTVRINGKGPFPMVVDTAAQTSLMAAGLAAELGLKPMADGIRVEGATGASQSRLYPVDRIGNALFDARYVAVVELSNSGVTDARGIIGMERFTDARLVVDRTARRIARTASGPAPAGFATIAGQRTAEGFVTVPMTLNGVSVPALVDSGAAATIVNAAAFRLLGWADTDPRISNGGEIRGAAAGGQAIRTARFDKVGVGRITLSNVPLSVADDGATRPSIILGSDLLNLFPGYAVDFPRAELHIRLPQGSDARGGAHPAP
ncbi:MAG: retroviral-like aspartic protease family protein [Sphingomonas adhaesiva]|uniref:retroviral-like aspartic protease family protein n=1 Tax=Sphingomonas adhaesiva TaxID=28212 RepID=UPI002FF5DC85